MSEDTIEEALLHLFRLSNEIKRKSRGRRIGMGVDDHIGIPELRIQPGLTAQDFGRNVGDSPGPSSFLEVTANLIKHEYLNGKTRPDEPRGNTTVDIVHKRHQGRTDPDEVTVRVSQPGMTNDV